MMYGRRRGRKGGDWVDSYSEFFISRSEPWMQQFIGGQRKRSSEPLISRRSAVCACATACRGCRWAARRSLWAPAAVRVIQEKLVPVHHTRLWEQSMASLSSLEVPYELFRSLWLLSEAYEVVTLTCWCERSHQAKRRCELAQSRPDGFEVSMESDMPYSPDLEAVSPLSGPLACGLLVRRLLTGARRLRRWHGCTLGRCQAVAGCRRAASSLSIGPFLS
jgi:hypothetical protein